MSKWVNRFFVVMLVTTMLSFSARPAAAEELTDEIVTAAIDRMVDALYGQINNMGHWDKARRNESGSGHESDAGQYGGTTALVVYSLLAAGENFQANPKLSSAIQFLTEAEGITGTYSVGLRAHVWGKLPNKFLDLMAQDADLLQQGIKDSGLYSYHLDDPSSGRGDNSNTQYGTLGVWEAEKRGIPVPESYWRLVEAHFLGSVNRDGGWGYYRNGPSYGSMVAAGLTVLFITQDYLHRAEAREPGAWHSTENGQAIERGLRWFDRNFTATTNPGKDSWLYYYLVGVERVGVASGYKYFGGKDWYIEGAKVVLRGEGGTGMVGRSNIVDTCFGLLFLVRGRVPVAMNKLEIPGYNYWNSRPRDVANTTNWLSNEIEQSMNWQIVSLNNTADSWMDAPVLYLAGYTELPEMDDNARRKLRRYLDLGGLIITSADKNDRNFSASAEALFEEIYADEGYKFQEIPEEDELYKVQYLMENPRIGARSLHNGVRHLVINVPKDISWELQMFSERDVDTRHFMGNVFHYATEKGQVRGKLERHIPMPSSDPPGRFVYVNRVRYDGNWNPEPLAWYMQSLFMRNQMNVGVRIAPVDMADLGEAGNDLAHVVGTDAANFSDAQLSGIRQFVDKGGVIFFESAGGNPEFDQSVRDALLQIYPGKQFVRLTSQPVISGTGLPNGFDNRKVSYRRFFSQRGMGSFREPRMVALMFDGEPRVIVSELDVSSGMLSQPIWGVFGYDAETSQKLMANILLYGEKVSPEFDPNVGTPDEEDADAGEDAGNDGGEIEL